MQIPDELQRARLKAEEARARAAAERLDVAVGDEFTEFKSWFAENREPLIIFGLLCLVIGFIFGFWAMQYLEHR